MIENPEEELQNFVARSEKLIKSLKHFTSRLEKQMERAKRGEEIGDNYETLQAMCEFKSIIRWSNPIPRYTDKTLRTIADIDDAFRAKKEKGFECFGV